MKQAAQLQSKAESGRGRRETGPFFTPIQTKLNLSRRGEKLEQEADHAADAIVHKRGPMAMSGVQISKQMTPIAQRTEEETQSAPERQSDPAYCEHEPFDRFGAREDEPLQMVPEEEEPVQLQENEEEEEHLQMEEEEEAVQARQDDETDVVQRSDVEEKVQAETIDAERQTEDSVQKEEEEEELQMRAADPALSPRAVRDQSVERQLRASRGRGNLLPEGVRQRMEQGLGADFSGVRVHTDHPAFLMTRMLNAKAFTSGRDIYFSPHRFAPNTKDGDHLLAHELAHTLHQSAVPVREDAIVQRAPEDQVAVRPEILNAVQVARSHIGQINSQLLGPDGNRVGWKRLLEVFRVAYGGEVIHPALIKRPIAHPNDLPHWCGIYAWHALRKAGLPLPPWKSGARMLDNTQVRPTGTLPQIGDIAYRDKLPNLPESAPLTHHQALVTGVEAHETAKDKPFHAVLVRTVDGNTAGQNNLGGQVEEKWQPIGNWKHFFDPAGKVTLPEIDSIMVDRAGEVVLPQVPEVPETASASDEAGPTDLTSLETASPIVAEPDAGPGAQVTELELPTVEDVSLEPAATVEKVSLEGTSDAATAGFTKASPSSMAITAPDLGATLDKKTKVEAAKVADQAPILTARTDGDLNPEITSPKDIPVPGDITLADAGKGPETGDLKAEPHHDHGHAPLAGNTPAVKDMHRQPEGGGFFDWLRNHFSNLLGSIRTTDSSVNTSAGPKPRVALSGDADVGRMERQRQDGTARLRAERDVRISTFKSHPGQSNIQPRRVEQAVRPKVKKETSEPIPSLEPGGDVADYASSEWPSDFRNAADQEMSKKLAPGMTEARTKAEKAGSDRDRDKEAAEAEAQRRTNKSNMDATSKQRAAVVAGRSDVAVEQGAAIQGAFDAVATFSKDASTEQTTKAKKIATDVRTGETSADDALTAGEKEAKRIKQEQEQKAAEKKKELAKKEKEESFWDAINPKKLIDALVSKIDDILNDLRTWVKEAIETAKNKAIGLINKARNAAINTLNGFRDWAKDKVNTYVKDRYPGLAKKLNEKIDSTVDRAITKVNAAADGAIEKVNEWAKALTAALDKILAAFQAALKLAVAAIGALLTGDFAGALKLAFEAGCKLAGVNPKPILDFLDRAGQQIMSILKKPGKFISNLLSAIGLGIRNFAKNFLQHFQSGVIKWLTGALSAVPITLPSKWDLKGFFSLIAQILGLTYENIKQRIILKFPKAASVFDKIEKGWKFVNMLLNKDYAALWEEVKARLSSIKDTIIAALQKWTLINVIKQGVMWLLSMLNPASAIVRLLKMLADLVFWLIENFARIKDFVLSVYGAISNIAAGVIKPAAKAVEQSLAKALPVVISFIASALGLGDIAGAIQGVIKKIQAPVNKAIDWLIDKVVAFARKLIAKLVGGAKKAGKKAKDAAIKLVKWWTEKRRFISKGGGDHKIYYKGESKSADLWISSLPKSFPDFIKEAKLSPDTTQKALAIEADQIYREQVLKSEDEMARLQSERAAIGTKDKTAYRQKNGELQTAIRLFRTRLLALSSVLKKMNIDDEAAALSDVSYNATSDPKTVTAAPLTFLPGSEKGSAPSEDPPGYEYARKINKEAGKTVWIRGHLLNDNVHGPGKAKNMVPIPQATNRLMESQAEADIKKRVHSQKEKLYFHASATFWPATAPEREGFPKTVTLTWKKAKKTSAGWTAGSKIKSVPFSSPAPPENVAEVTPGIQSASTGELAGAINEYRPNAVTRHFVGILKAHAPYQATSSIRTKLTHADAKYDVLDQSKKTNRDNQITATIDAVTAKKIELV